MKTSHEIPNEGQSLPSTKGPIGSQTEQAGVRNEGNQRTSQTPQGVLEGDGRYRSEKAPFREEPEEELA